MGMMQLFFYRGLCFMKVLNVINNNVVSSLDEKNREIVVMGKGIGFHKKPGEEIADTQVEKVFRLPDETHDLYRIFPTPI